MRNANALILVDIQNDYFTGGLWPVEDMDRVASQAAEVLHDARTAGEMIVHVYHEAASDSAPFFRPGTRGAQIHASVAPVKGEAVIIKHRPNSFHETDLHTQLQSAGITHVTIIGAMTQMCIDATTRAAQDLGYDVTLVSDACGAKALSFNGVHLGAAEVQAAFLGPLAMSYAKLI
ncbi:cysteine hydrolase [Sulfitobacter mediterraneus]|uniref:cysteine hydrolase family protein n=1 Tax=Sulfitobacter mediterraneus TaxID=83219 RepID=UPI0019399084|nr:cysteine hydrolase family protein [Sulfitobacter mediterraneus]MBM1555732.1 cysteine hydrolase [Sulfitobacter mediterraneus]MBM1566715.1 cysteine hydrolase [Sulfitobacter mediterraneus]MBM1570517.1 cysteine hydrolase [Sulfitobacter mediterraneus]MBM1574316.1 cysteine hydrolase [Sulfitobacter mediterraneus]MBM1578690.1 cysteine hydrolase [Sulfitobacter mediterraneus]